MSNHLAIATVSAAVKATLKKVLPQTLDELAVDVATGRPEQPKPGENGPKVTVFLYQVTPNAAWRNADLPTRRSDGTAVQRPQAAIDLHYLISFAGDESKQVPERLLGAALAILHAQPLFSREIIRKLVADSANDHLSTSDLADQIELVRLVPLPLTIDELSKLWSVFFQIPYRLSVAWQASVVLLDVDVPARTPLPVRTRNLYVDTLRRPVLEGIEVEMEPGEAVPVDSGQPILPDSVLLLRGRDLQGSDRTEVWIGGVEVVLETVADTRIRVQLKPGLRAGVHSVQVSHPRLLGTPLAEHRGLESNALPIVLRPVVGTKTGDEVDAEFGTAPDPEGKLPSIPTVQIPVAPTVEKSQRAVLLLSGGPVGYSLRALLRTSDGDPKFNLKGVQSGRYAVRVQVDGAESLLTQGPSGLFDRPWLEILIP